MIKIKVLKFCSDEVMLQYVSHVTPSKDDVIKIAGKNYSVTSVRHVTKVMDAGSPVETASLDYVEVEVLR